MKVLRWILAIVISVGLWFPLFKLIEWIFSWIFLKIFDFWIWVTDYIPWFKFILVIEGFAYFIFVMCASSLIASAISGFIGGLISPPTAQDYIKGRVFGIAFLPIAIFSSVFYWISEHWFLSSLWVLYMIYVGFVFVDSATGNNAS